MFHIIGTIIVGFVVGVIAKFLMPGRNEPQGFVMTAILGIVGSFVGTWLAQRIGLVPMDAGNAGFIASVVGAIIVLAIWGAATKNRQA